MKYTTEIVEIDGSEYKKLLIKKSALFDDNKNFNKKSREIYQIIKKENISFPFRRLSWNNKINLESVKKIIFKNQKTKWNNDEYFIKDQEQNDSDIVKIPFKLENCFLFQNGEKKFLLYMNDFNKDYWVSDIITEYWTEFSRVKSFIKSYNNKSPLECWENYDEKYIMPAIKFILNKNKEFNTLNLREALYCNKSIIECSHEKVSFLTSLFKMLLNPMSGLKIKVFDACVGWGDRILASHLSGVDTYIGVEPNKNSFNYFNNMIKDIGENYKVLCDGMPLADIEENDFDLAFISPPCYNSEFYSNDEKQSISIYPNKKDWYIHFLFKTILKTWSLIKEEGYLIIQSLLAKEINCYIALRLENVKYLGVISVVCGTKRNKPLWIFKKSKNHPSLEFYDKETIIDSFQDDIKQSLLNKEDLL